MNRWCFLVRTRLTSKIPVAPPLPVAWSCKPNTGILTLGSSPMGSCSPKIAGRFTASGQIIVMGRCQPVVRLVLSRRYHSLPRSFNQYCDFSRQYDPNPSPEVLPNGTLVPPYSGPGVRSFIRDFGRYDLLDYSAYASWFIHLADLIASSVDEYWVSQGSSNEVFWAHEVRLCDQGEMQCLTVRHLISVQQARDVHFCESGCSSAVVLPERVLL